MYLPEYLETDNLSAYGCLVVYSSKSEFCSQDSDNGTVLISFSSSCSLECLLLEALADFQRMKQTWSLQDLTLIYLEKISEPPSSPLFCLQYTN